ncbi:hypothetical protein [Chitinophaga sp. LS1]|uniref:hypothetical protein n=1 Tax=Chitinophaga sp. LS1 TaxID=3051176 RepID=UPI002AAAE147|nr:hypothetical protein [Chitinophaga sp. LS1]WPV68543.1 hypothetical protein QQL36_07410 [Chitinophaga sp. LS1]
MAIQTLKISTKNLPIGYTIIPSQTIKKSKKRINAAMKITTKKFQEKKLASLEKASKTFISK